MAEGNITLQKMTICDWLTDQVGFEDSEDPAIMRGQKTVSPWQPVMNRFITPGNLRLSTCPMQGFCALSDRKMWKNTRLWGRVAASKFTEYLQKKKKDTKCFISYLQGISMTAYKNFFSLITAELVQPKIKCRHCSCWIAESQYRMNSVSPVLYES